jgi:3-isopropylmalate/(R)-2-methylmalate dehydratase large subunit
MEVRVDGALKKGVTAKDIILALIAKIGTGGGTGHCLEYRGAAIRALNMEERMTICNMSIEAGRPRGPHRARRDTFKYLRGSRSRRRASRSSGTTSRTRARRSTRRS